MPDWSLMYPFSRTIWFTDEYWLVDRSLLMGIDGRDQAQGSDQLVWVMVLVTVTGRVDTWPLSSLIIESLFLLNPNTSTETEKCKNVSLISMGRTWLRRARNRHFSSYRVIKKWNRLRSRGSSALEKTIGPNGWVFFSDWYRVEMKSFNFALGSPIKKLLQL